LAEIFKTLRCHQKTILKILSYIVSKLGHFISDTVYTPSDNERVYWL